MALVMQATVGGPAERTTGPVLGARWQRALLLAYMVSIAGPLLAGWFFAPLFRLPAMNHTIVHWPALMATILLLAVSASYAGCWPAESGHVLIYNHFRTSGPACGEV